jgi:hypothetical protein
MVSRDDPWRRCRLLKRVNILAIVFIFLTFAVVLFGQIDMRSRGVHLVVFGWMIFGLVMLTLTHEIRCPRCSQRFYAKGAEFWQITTECLHCGLAKYADVGTPANRSGDGR